MMMENYIKTYKFRQKSGKGFFNDIINIIISSLEIFSVEVNSMKNLSIKLSGMIAALALMVTSVGVNSCMFLRISQSSQRVQKSFVNIN